MRHWPFEAPLSDLCKSRFRRHPRDAVRSDSAVIAVHSTCLLSLISPRLANLSRLSLPPLFRHVSPLRHVPTQLSNAPHQLPARRLQSTQRRRSTSQKPNNFRRERSVPNDLRDHGLVVVKTLRLSLQGCGSCGQNDIILSRLCVEQLVQHAVGSSQTRQKASPCCRSVRRASGGECQACESLRFHGIRGTGRRPFRVGRASTAVPDAVPTNDTPTRATTSHVVGNTHTSAASLPATLAEASRRRTASVSIVGGRAHACMACRLRQVAHPLRAIPSNPCRLAMPRLRRHLRSTR
ncbi:hypothetical protein PSP20601_05427 [Pandoraea sputorum]|nr:hypothetical protein PSP20601_05427 [Pandoraea sputorum]